jgi:hypothetical protein
MTLATEPEALTAVAPREPKSGALVRLAAAVGGLVVLVCAGLVTVGAVVIVLIAMAVVGGVQRKNGRALTRTGHWVTACSTIALLILLFVGTVFAVMPHGTMGNAKHAMDSTNAVAAKQQPPAWMRRLYPQYSQAATSSKPSQAMVWISMIIGGGFTVSIFSALLGTLSWGAGMLLGLAVVGRWPGVRGESLEDLVTDLPRLSHSPDGALQA